MVKSKLPPQSGPSLEAVEPHSEKGAIKYFFLCYQGTEFKMTEKLQEKVIRLIKFMANNASVLNDKLKMNKKY